MTSKFFFGTKIRGAQIYVRANLGEGTHALVVIGALLVSLSLQVANCRIIICVLYFVCLLYTSDAADE